MRGSREGKGPPATDLLVCFPSRAHLSLMPKPICSPARPSEPRHPRRPSHLRKPSFRSGASSPLPWSSRGKNDDDLSEPTSPKVTCAGQIKVRAAAKPGPCKSWQSVMEEIERMHKRNAKKKPRWMEALGLKKEVMQFLTCLRNVRFDFRCFGAPPPSEVTSEDDDDDEEEEEEEDDEDNFGSRKDDCGGGGGGDGGGSGSRAVFSKWFMILQEDNLIREESGSRKVIGDEEAAPPPPPPNALLLMRCRSAPAKSWLEEREEEEEERKGEIEREKRRDLTEFCGEIEEIDRVMEEIKEKISRCRSCRR